MKKFFVLIFIIFSVAACGSATVVGVNKTKISPKFDPATVNRVAIVDFDANKGVKYSTAIVADKFTVELVDSRIFSLMDRNDIKKVMYEVGFQQKGSLAGILNDATLERLSAMGADSIITGNLISFRQVERNGLILLSEAHVTAKLLKIETSEVLWSAEIQKRSKSEKGKDADPAEKLLSDIISEMSKPLKSEPGGFKKMMKSFL